MLTGHVPVAFAYAFAQSQFSFMSELRRPKDYTKAVFALGIMEIIIYVRCSRYLRL